MAGFLSSTRHDEQAGGVQRALTLQLRVGEAAQALVQEHVTVQEGLNEVWVGMGESHPVLLRLDSDLLPAESLALMSRVGEGWSIRVLPKTLLQISGPSKLQVKGSASDPERSIRFDPAHRARFELRLEPYTLVGWWDDTPPALPIQGRVSAWDPVLAGLHLFFYGLVVFLLLLVGSQSAPERRASEPLEERWVRVKVQERVVETAQTVVIDKRTKKRMQVKPLVAKVVSTPTPTPAREQKVDPTPSPKPQEDPPVRPVKTPKPEQVAMLPTPVPRVSLPDLPELPASAPQGPGKGITGGNLGGSTASGRSSAQGGGLGDLPQSGQAQGSGGVKGGYALLGSTGGRTQGSSLGDLPVSTGRSSGGGISGGNLALPSGTGGGRGGGGLGELPGPGSQGSGGRSSGGIVGGNLSAGGSGGRGSGGGGGLGDLPGSSGQSSGGGGRGIDGGAGLSGTGAARIQALQALKWVPPTGEGAYVSETQRERLERRLNERTCKIAGVVSRQLSQAHLSSDGSSVYLEGQDGIRAKIPIQACGTRARPLLNVPAGTRSLSQIEALEWCLARLP